MARRGGLKRIIAGLERELAPSVRQAAHVIEDEAKGSIMRGSVSGKGHVASSPGEPPNNDLGTLHGNIEVTQPEPLQALVTSAAPYAAALEFGTSRMAARPYMGPAAIMMAGEAAAIVGKGVAAAINKLGK